MIGVTKPSPFFTALLPLCECKLKNTKQGRPGDVTKVDIRGEFPNCINFASEFLPGRLRVPLNVHQGSCLSA